MKYFLLALHPPVLFSSFLATLLFLKIFVILKILISGLLLLSLADIRSRTKDYIHLKNMFNNPSISGDTIRGLFHRFRRSWCQRTVAIYSYKSSAGWLDPDAAKRFYHAAGYRWWHILPDGTISRNCPYLKLSFYKALICGTFK